MKKNYIYIGLLALMLCSSCNYLDIVPEERTKEEDTYSTPGRIKEFLASCYSYLPTTRQILTESYDMICAEETSYFRKEAFSTFNEGDYGPTNLGMTSYTWQRVWDGIGQCYRFLDALDKMKEMPELSAEELKHYRAEAEYLIGYYHFISLRAYGPTMIMRQAFDLDMPLDDYPERSSYDEVVTFIDQQIEKALPGLAMEHPGDEYGRITYYTALALRSRMYLYAASPLFNGNDWYADFKSPIDGRNLISQQYSEDKWRKVVEVTEQAIKEMKDADFHLYGDAEAGEPSANKPGFSKNKAERRVRYCVLDTKGGDNPEVIWCDTRKEGNYGYQRRSVLKQSKGYIGEVQGCIVPTFQSVERFYTKNGLPVEYDKNYGDPYAIVTMPDDVDGNGYTADNSGMKTLRLHCDREPRFYANVGFQGGYFEIGQYNGATPGKNNGDRAVVLDLRFGKAQGRKNEGGAPQTLNYSVTGYNNKKLLPPSFTTGVVEYPLPLFRMAELYLNLAEAYAALGEIDKCIDNLDVIRTRAGIPGVKDAWDNYSTQPKYYENKENLMEIVRRERMLELYMEGHQFYDIRRWKIAEQFLGVPVKGLNTLGETDEDFLKVVELDLLRRFHKGQYLMPIPYDETQKTPQVIQNPFYN
ncbi:RagB/SusD family nutrient uptake outer membrane protein [Bacteroides caccae]|jgi:hypothetical protein|uniref:RagB/SusD family nutrient uptake outer membrane protein n=1 Tax=Bacteroides caccae TaxID=47678 RepID=UPI003567EE37